MNEIPFFAFQWSGYGPSVPVSPSLVSVIAVRALCPHAVPHDTLHVGFSRLSGNKTALPTFRVNLLSVLPEAVHTCLQAWKHGGGPFRGPMYKNPKFHEI